MASSRVKQLLSVKQYLLHSVFALIMHFSSYSKMISANCSKAARLLSRLSQVALYQTPLI